MTAHLDVEILSTYLDRQLTSSATRQVEEHLELCGDCRDRLWSLEKVVGSLQRLDRLAPPPSLGPHLGRLATLQASELTLTQRLEKGLERFTYQSSILPFFAVVVALILIIYMLSWGLHRQSTGRIPVHLEPETAMVEALETASSSQIAGRSFLRVGEVWIEEGLEEATVSEVISGTDPRVQSWFDDSPELERVRDLGETVRLRWGERVVEIRFVVP